MEFNELIRERFSCRALSDREIPHESMNRIFEAARLAPTAVNKQPFKVWAIESPDARAKLAETTGFTFGAGVFLVVGGKANEAWVRSYDERNFADVDAAIVATHIHARHPQRRSPLDMGWTLRRTEAEESIPRNGRL